MKKKNCVVAVTRTAEGFDGRLTGSLAFFDLTRENIATPVPGMPNIREAAGEAQHRGIELDVSGALTEDWRLIASYSYIDSEITKDRDAEGGTGNQGNRFRNAPRHAGSLWTHYEFTQLGWPGLTAGIGAFFVGQREGDNAQQFPAPGLRARRRGARLLLAHRPLQGDGPVQ